MPRLDLSPEDAARLTQILQEKLHALAIEINRTEQLDFKASLRQMERTLDQIVRQLEITETR